MKKSLLVLGFYVFISIVLTWPLILHLNSLIIDRVDGLLITWIYNWSLHSFTGGINGILNVLNANIFYPNRLSFVFSDFHFFGMLITAPFVLISGEPLVAYNLNLLINIAITGFSLFLLLKTLTRDSKISLLGSLIYTLSPFRLSYGAHPQLFASWMVILPMYFLIKSNFKRFIFFFLLAVANSPLNFYFLFFISGLYFIFVKRKDLMVLKAIILSCVFCIPVMIPYLSVSKIYNYTRPINDAIHFSLQFPDLLNVGNTSRLFGIIPQTSAGTPAFLGIGTFILLFIYTILRRKKIKIPVSHFDFWAKLSAIFFFTLSLGPALHIFSNTIHVGPIPAIPLPYLIFYYLIPGFSGFRTPSRWLLPAFLMLTIYFSLKLRHRLTRSVIFGLCLLVVVEVGYPIKFVSVPSVANFPQEQIWLSKNDKNQPIIQFPIYNWSDHPGIEQETLREYYSTIHWHPMYNGFSGFSPKEWEQKVAWLQKEFPSNESLAYLQSVGIKLILVPVSWEEKMGKFNQVFQVTRFPDTIIYRFHD